MERPYEARNLLMKSIAAILLASIAGLVTLCAQEAPLADSADGFGKEQGGKGWSYHYYVSSKDGKGTYVPEDALPMKWSPDSGEAKEIWTGPLTWFYLGKESAKSRLIEGGYQGWAVRRWTSDYEGEIEISGTVKCTAAEGDGPDAGDGIGCRIFSDGKEIFSKLLPPQAVAEIQVRTSVRKGSKLDFAVTPGPGLNALFDGSHFRATIRKAK